MLKYSSDKNYRSVKGEKIKNAVITPRMKVNHITNSVAKLFPLTFGIMYLHTEGPSYLPVFLITICAIFNELCIASVFNTKVVLKNLNLVY